MSLLRLDKFLADMHIGTISYFIYLFLKGRITLDEQMCRQPETKIDTDRSEVTFDKQVILMSIWNIIYFTSLPDVSVQQQTGICRPLWIRLMHSEKICFR